LGINGLGEVAPCHGRQRLAGFTDDRIQSIDGAVDIVLELGKHAIEVAFNLVFQVPFGQGTQYGHRLVDHLVGDRNQFIDALGQNLEEAVLVGDFQPLGQVAGHGALHHSRHFVLNGDFLGAVKPLDHGTQALARAFVIDRAGNHTQ